MLFRFAIFVFVVIAPSLAWACPGCIGANEENRLAFLGTTALLTFIPLIVIGVTVRWLQLRARRLEEESRQSLEFLGEKNPR